MDFEADSLQFRGFHAGHFHRDEFYVSDGNEARFKLVPQGSKIIVFVKGGFKVFNQLLRIILGTANLQTQRTLLVLQGREGVLAHLQLLANFIQRRFVILKFDRHKTLIFPIFINQGLLDAGFCFGEVFAEEFPSSVEHLVETDVDVD